MRNTVTSKLLAASAVGVLTLGAAACSSDDDSPGDDPIEDPIDDGVDEVDDGVEEDLGDDGIDE